MFMVGRPSETRFCSRACYWRSRRKADETLVRHTEQLAKLLGSELLLVHVADGWAARAFDQLKLNGYKVVHMRAKTPLQSLPEYDAMLVKEQRLPTVSSRPTNDVVKTVGE